MLSALLLPAIIVATSIASALCALLILARLGPGGTILWPRRALTEPHEPAIFLFDDRELVDATPAATELLRALPPSGSDWNRLVEYLARKFPNLDTEVSRLVETGGFELFGLQAGAPTLRAHYSDGLARLTLSGADDGPDGIQADGLGQQAQDEELTFLREALAASTALIWRQNAAGNVVWANRAYLARARTLQDGDDSLAWPLPALFAPGPVVAGPSGARRIRLLVEGPGNEEWFDCVSHPVDDGTIQVAQCVDALLKAENALRGFIQTLTKTFAHLPIGLAIFDKQRQLALFNPALIDLTTLAADFLSARPTLFAFMDRLREARVVPEPKDYRNWVQHMAALEKAAVSGHYEETWTLATGQTYKVTGRPHPDGAVAFLIEDISAEISLTRRFRSEIELGQEVIDSMDDAVAVFSAAGLLVLSNAAYAGLWGGDHDASPGSTGILDAVRTWQAATLPTPIWGDVRDFVGDIFERAEWRGEVLLKDGGAVACRFAPLTGGATLVAFSRAPGERPRLRRVRSARKITEPEPVG